MTLRLSIFSSQLSTTTLEGFPLRVELTSEAADAMNLPAPGDQTSALSIEVRDAFGTLLRTMSGLTHQTRMTTARRDLRNVLGKLHPGETWTWKLDVCILHSPLPAGDVDLFARYVYEPGGVDLTAGPLSVRVEELAVRTVSHVRDNCVLDGLSTLIVGEPLLLIAQQKALESSSDSLDPASRPRLTRPGSDFGQTSTDGGDDEVWIQPKHVVRLYNTMRPLASWYSIAPDLPPEPEDVCCATNAFFQTASFDAYYSRWVLHREDDVLRASRYQVGAPTGDARQMQIPAGRDFLRAAYAEEDGSLHALFQGEGDLLESYRIDGESSTIDFSHQLELARAASATVAIDPRHIHAIVGGRELRYDRLSRRGERLDRRTLFRSRMGPYSLRIDPVRRAAVAVFWDGPSGRNVQLAYVSLVDGTVSELTLTLDVRGDVAELAAARDRNNRWHLAAAIETGALMYWRDETGPRLVMNVDPPCHPFVIAEQHTYVGFSQPGLGWGFVEMRDLRPAEE